MCQSLFPNGQRGVFLKLVSLDVKQSSDLWHKLHNMMRNVVSTCGNHKVTREFVLGLVSGKSNTAGVPGILLYNQLRLMMSIDTAMLVHFV